MVVQDIDAPINLVTDKIRDLPNYHKYVSQVRKVSIYQNDTFQNVSSLN